MDVKQASTKKSNLSDSLKEIDSLNRKLEELEAAHNSALKESNDKIVKLIEEKNLITSELVLTKLSLVNCHKKLADLRVEIDSMRNKLKVAKAVHSTALEESSNTIVVEKKKTITSEPTLTKTSLFDSDIEFSDPHMENNRSVPMRETSFQSQRSDAIFASTSGETNCQPLTTRATDGKLFEANKAQAIKEQTTVVTPKFQKGAIQMKNLSPIAGISASANFIMDLPLNHVERTATTSTKKIPVTNKKNPNEAAKKLLECFLEYAIRKFPPEYLFEGLPRDSVCQICIRPGNVQVCSGKCGGSFHSKCSAEIQACNTSDWYAHYSERMFSDAMIMDCETEDFIKPSILRTKTSTTNEVDERFVCATCLLVPNPKCFVCSMNTGNLIECQLKGCSCHYHVNCLEYWPQHEITRDGDTVESFICPRHACQICIADSMKRNYVLKVENDKELIRCLLCPASYHRMSNCIPAGSELLSHSQMVCPRHRKTSKKPVNTDWCLWCGKGGSLICCKSCPTTVHKECLNVHLADEKYICEQCKSGRLPIYGEIVWVKYGGCKWWPGMLVDPFNVPANVATDKIGLNYMCVRFFGTHDFGWACQGYVYLYQMADSKHSKVIKGNAVQCRTERGLRSVRIDQAKI